jgi:L-lysine 2,3-aminomutase
VRETELEQSDIDALDTSVLHQYVNQSIQALKHLFSKKKHIK